MVHADSHLLAVGSLCLPENPQDERDLSALGRALHALRIEHGLSAGELAARCHTTLERVHELEAGEHDPTYDLMLALAQRDRGEAKRAH
jgi:DNA-binding transcriptional regulator YiaG